MRYTNLLTYLLMGFVSHSTLQICGLTDDSCNVAIRRSVMKLRSGSGSKYLGSINHTAEVAEDWGSVADV